MKNFFRTLLITFLLIIACGGETQEIAIEELPTTTFEVSKNTSTSSTPPTSTYEINYVDYEENINKNEFYIYFSEYRKTTLSGDVFLQIKGHWNQVSSLEIYFDDECEIYEEFKFNKTGLSGGTIAINISETFENNAKCSNDSKATYIRVMQQREKTQDTVYLYFLDNGEYFLGGKDTTIAENDKFCCHNNDFEALNSKVNEILNTTITTTSTIRSTTTTTLPKYILPKIELFSCPESFTMDSNLVNLLIQYSLIAGSSEIISFTIERYDIVNGKNTYNYDFYDKEKALEVGIVLPRNKNEEVFLTSTFLIQNQDEKRDFKYKVIVTDAQGSSSSKECKFVMNPNSDTFQGSTTTTTTTIQTTTSTTLVSPSTTLKVNACTVWRDQSETNRYQMDTLLKEYVDAYIDYESGNISLDSFINLISNQANRANSIYLNQNELSPDTQNSAAHTEIKNAFVEYTLALGYFKKGYQESSSYYQTLGDIALDSGDDYIYYYKLYKKSC